MTLKRSLQTGTVLVFVALGLNACSSGPEDITLDNVSTQIQGMDFTGSTMIIKGSSLNKADLLSLLNESDPKKKKEQWASFSAKSISVPDARFTYQIKSSLGFDVNMDLHLKDLELKNIAKGKIEAFTSPEMKGTYLAAVPEEHFISKYVKDAKLNLLHRNLSAKNIESLTLTGKMDVAADDKRFWADWFTWNIESASIQDTEISAQAHLIDPKSSKSGTFNLKADTKNTLYQNIAGAKIGLVSFDSLTSSVDLTLTEGDVSQPFMQASLNSGKSVSEGMDLDGMLEYSFLKADSEDRPLKTVIKNSSFEDYTFTMNFNDLSENPPVSMDMDMTFKSIRSYDYKLRPLYYFSLPELISSDYTAKLNQSSPEGTARYIAELYTDVLFASETSGDIQGAVFNMKFRQNETDQAHIKGSVSQLSWKPDLFDSRSIQISAEFENFQNDFSLEQLTFSNFSFAPTVQGLRELLKQEQIIPALSQPGIVGSLIPKLGKWELKGLVDTITEDMANNLLFSLKSLVVNIDEQTYGVPSTMQISLEDIVLNKSVLQQIEEKIGKINLDELRLSFNMDYGWNKDTKDLTVSKLGGAISQIGSVNFAASLKNIPDSAFTMHKSAAMALIGVTAKDTSVDIKDDGGFDRLLGAYSEESGMDAETMKSLLSASLDMLPSQLSISHEHLTTIAQAVKQFIQKPGNLSIIIRSKNENGIGMMQFMSSQDNPAQLLDLVTVEATAN